MIDIDINSIDKLEALFESKYASIPRDDDNFWIDYLDKIEVFILHSEWLRETFNDSAYKDHICIHNPEETNYERPFWLLVPRQLAEKCLVLNGLPE